MEFPEQATPARRVPFTQEKKVQTRVSFLFQEIVQQVTRKIGTGNTKRGYSRRQGCELHLLGIGFIGAFLGQTGESRNDLRNPSNNLWRLDSDPLPRYVSGPRTREQGRRRKSLTCNQ